jgi:murein DD-endopeptidase MepM/ murein hydrolase activator NlpD
LALATRAGSPHSRDILIPMTRRQALLLPLSGSLVAQVNDPALAPRSKTAAAPEDALMRWNPRPVFNGAPVLFQSKAFSGAGNWLGKKIEFRPDGDGFSALAGVNLNRAPGHYPLDLGHETIDIAVIKRAYPSSAITVPQKFVEPPKEVQKQIEEEVAIKQRVFASSLPDRLWRGPFVAPAKTTYTSSFGVRRTYNGKTLSVHQGLDYRAAFGTQVSASNSGRVAIAHDMYFEGGFIVIDHGESIFTLYMHLSEFLVSEGANVEKGDVIGRSGSSGRVTGPHLHFAVRWEGAYLEPSTLLTLWRSGPPDHAGQTPGRFLMDEYPGGGRLPLGDSGLNSGIEPVWHPNTRLDDEGQAQRPAAGK